MESPQGVQPAGAEPRQRGRVMTGHEKLLGAYLKDRRAKLDPAALGYSCKRRRTPGLRREEVAQRAEVSVTWYTWLEQGRGGVPSSDLLERIAEALALTEDEREHLFLIAQHRPPEVRYQPPRSVSRQLQRVLDSLEFSPAYVKTAAWDIVAWNRAATAVLTDYAKLPPPERNALRLLFGDSEAHARMADWEHDARFAVATFRRETARAGASTEAEALVSDLSRSSPAFASMWLENDVRTHGEGIKHVRQKGAGLLTLEYSTFAVDGQPDLGLVIYTPATADDLATVKRLLDQVDEGGQN